MMTRVKLPLKGAPEVEKHDAKNYTKEKNMRKSDFKKR